MSDSTETPGLAKARETLRIADAGNDIHARWHVYCPFGHHVATWETDPGEKGLRQRCPVWNGSEECSDTNPGEERDDNEVQHIPASHFEPTEVDKGHLRVALAEVDRLTVERDESWAEMDAVHSLLSLRGVVTTDHYRHVGARGSMLPRVLEVVDARDAVLSDVAAAAGELRVPIPTPGTDAARLLLANVAMRRERDAYKRAKEENDDRFMTERDAARRDRDTALVDLSALRLEHEAVCGLLTHTRRDRDEARAALRATVGVAPTPGRVVLLGNDTDLHQLAHALRADPVREALDAMPALDLTAWIDAPMDAPLNRAQRRAKDKL